jgi:hypothetical protein
MTTIAINLDDVIGGYGTLPGKSRAASVVWALRNGGGPYVRRLADAIEAAADRRVIVLDVDALASDVGVQTPESLRLKAEALNLNGFGDEAHILHRVANALDSLTPPRPPEPTLFGAVVIGEGGRRWVRSYSVPTEKPWVSGNSHRAWADVEVVEILSEGVS